MQIPIPVPYGDGTSMGLQVVGQEPIGMADIESSAAHDRVGPKEPIAPTWDTE